MDDITNLLDILNYSLDLDVITFETHLKLCVEQGIFNAQHTKFRIPQLIDSCFNKTAARYKGFLLLKEYLCYCYTSTFTDHAISWMSQCLKSFNGGDTQESQVLLEVLTLLLEKSENNVDINKDVVKNILPKLITALVRIQPENKLLPETLACLEVCMKVYSGQCEMFRAVITEFLLNTIHSTSRHQKLLANCISLLPGLGGGGKQGISHKSAWSQQYESLILTLHDTLEQIFEDLTETQEFQRPEFVNKSLIFPDVSGANTWEEVQQLGKRASDISECIAAMHSKPFAVTKDFDPVYVLRLIYRGLIVSNTHLGSEHTMEAKALTLVLPKVHLALLKLLESLILCCGRNLQKHGLMICKLLNNILDDTLSVNSVYGMTRPYSSVRIAAYDCLCTWITIAQTSSYIHVVAQDLLLAVLPDVYSEKPSVNLNMCQKVKKPGAKQHKKKQLASKAKFIQDSTDKILNVTVNKDVCLRAVKTLVLIVYSANKLLKPEFFRSVEKTALCILSSMYGGSLDIPIPYTDAECRAEMYNLLLALCLVNGTTNHCFTLFTSGLNDISPQVISQCQVAVQSIQKICQPSAPSLAFQEERINPDVPPQLSKEDILNMPITVFSQYSSPVLVIRIQDNWKISQSSFSEEVDYEHHVFPITVNDEVLIQELYHDVDNESSSSSVVEIISDSDSSDHHSNYDFHPDEDSIVDEFRSIRNGSVNSDSYNQTQNEKNIEFTENGYTDISEENMNVQIETKQTELNVLKRLNNIDLSSEFPEDVIKKPKLYEDEENRDKIYNEDVTEMLKDFVDELA